MRAAFQNDISAVRQIPALPKILDVVCATTGMGFAAVARVTDAAWVACAVQDNIALGLVPGDELDFATTLCAEIRAGAAHIAIDSVAESPAYAGHATPALYGFQSYISVPIVLGNGAFFGTLCAIDPAPAQVDNAQTIGMFTLFAELIACHLDAGTTLLSSDARLHEIQETGELREQFIAVLGHDLRNPLASIDACGHLLLRTPLNEKALMLVGLMQNSVTRMASLIDNVLDFARGRLGAGLTLTADADLPLEPVLDQVVAELRLAWPERQLDVNFDIACPVSCDRGRLAQLLSNLLGNAMTHGDPASPIRVESHATATLFELSVTNGGTPIPPKMLERLFQPFFRGDVRDSQQGLGLGLYIASEVARAHGGRIDVNSDDSETRFTFTMPLVPQLELV
jgi:signal transduction histidine kinase